MPRKTSQPDKPVRRATQWILRRGDQAAVGVVVILALAAAGLWWISSGGTQNRLIELERLPPQTARYEVDVNTADWPELSQIPGLGETISRRIVESRKADGPFTDLQQLRRVRGIGPRTLERISPYLRPLPETSNVAER